MERIVDKHILDNGLVILGEPMETVKSVAFGFMLPAGAARLPAGCCGSANIIEDWMFRGAAGMDSRALSDALDSLGLHRASSVGTSHLSVGAALEAENLDAALEFYAAVILEGRLTDEQFVPAKQSAMNNLLALDDNPRRKVMLRLKERFYPEPLGRSVAGEMEQLKELTADTVRRIAHNNFDVSQTIFSIAGKYDFDVVCGRLEKLFGSQQKKSTEHVTVGEAGPKYTHIDNEGAQVHIGLMTAASRPVEDEYYNARMAVSVLSGGMSARLFTEVREKRGLCYAIGAQYHGLKEAAGVACYAGTVPETAQQTLDVVREQFGRLGEGITEEEIDRAKAGLKSSLILSSESSAGRAGQIAKDYYLLGRVRSLDEIKQKIEETSVDSVTQYLRDNKFEDYTVVTIGPKQVKVG